MRRATSFLFVSGLAAIAFAGLAPRALAADPPKRPQAKMEILEDEPSKPEPKKVEAPPAEKKAEAPPPAEEKKPETPTKVADSKQGGKPKGAGGDVAPKPQAAMVVEDAPAAGPSAPPPSPIGDEKIAIADYIRERTGDVHECYQRAVDHSPTLQGKMYVVLYIGPNGRVIGATTQGLENGDMIRCILPLVRKWEFDKPKSGGKLMVKYPFVFRPQASR